MHGRKLAQRVEVAGETAFCYAADPQPLLSDLATRAGVRYLHRPANLEDLFIKLTAGNCGIRAMRAIQATTKIWAVPALSARFVPVWRRNLLVWKKLAIASILGNIADPLLYMLALGYGIGSLVGEVGGMSYVAFIGTGMVCQSAMFTASFEGMYSAFSRMHVQRTWDGIINAPYRLDDVVLRGMAWDGTKAVMSTAAILAVIMILGYGHTWLAIWILPLGFVVGLRSAPRAGDERAGARLRLLHLFLHAGADADAAVLGRLLPVEQMPAWLATIADFLPLKHAIDLARR
jgi:lipooligosaccharide transport system permease protein